MRHQAAGPLRPQAPRRRPRRTVAVVLAAAATAVALLPATATPATAAPRTDAGLVGRQDAGYDGVYRQGLAILGWRAAGRTPPASVVAWLVAQQCPDGGFEPYRASTASPCRPGSTVTFTGQDTNSTALGALGLLAAGQRARAARATAWLRASQNRDGGFPFVRGGRSDVNSTGLVVAALRSAGLSPGAVAAVGRRSAAAYLASAQLRCAAPAAVRGSLAFQVSAPLVANDLATAQAAAGLLGLPPARTGAVRVGTPVIGCRTGVPTARVTPGDAAAGYLARRLVATRGRLPGAFGPGTDWSATAWAVLAVAGSRSGRVGLTYGVNALARNVNAYARDAKGVDQPAALGLLALVARAAGANPSRFGGVDLPARLAATVRP